jgi:hypothetical protein
MNMTRRSFLAAPLGLAAGVSKLQDDWQGIGRVVAVGDVHGDCDALAETIRMSGLIDDQNRWIGGRAHLVQIGDVPARGPQTRKVFDLLMELEKEAAIAGGRVHAIIGNHEAGVIYGDLRNILPEEYGEFREPGSEQRLAEAYEAEVAAMRNAGRLPSDPAELEGVRKSWFERHPPGFVEHRKAFSPSGFYGSWICRNNAVIRINDTLFVHGGISPKYAGRTRRELNVAIRRSLADPAGLQPATAADTQGPLWYRGLAEEAENPRMQSHLSGVLKFHGVRRIVIGHSVTRTAILPRFGGRVINIDIGLSRFYGRPPACLVLETSSAHVLHRGTKIPLPGPGRIQMTQYIKAVEAADEQPSPVLRLLGN